MIAQASGERILTIGEHTATVATWQRAIARAFRFGLGVGAVALEDLGEVTDDDHGQGQPARPAAAAPVSRPVARPPVNGSRPVGAARA